VNIAVFGGRFDPPHIGHYWVVQQVIEYGPSIDRVFLVPAAMHQWKPIVASAEDRMTMLRFHQMENVVVSDIEIRRGGISYSIDTIREIKKETGASIYWIVGADIITEFSRWEKADELVKEATFLVFPRDPYNIPKQIPAGFSVIAEKNLITTNISSTIIRTRVKNGLSIDHFVISDVANYIKQKGLYRDFSDTMKSE
jgi:nicotinate-nucleotide adenylyltransferase